MDKSFIKRKNKNTEKQMISADLLNFSIQNIHGFSHNNANTIATIETNKSFSNLRLLAYNKRRANMDTKLIDKVNDNLLHFVYNNIIHRISNLRED